MSVDFPTSYPANAASASKPVDNQTLQETFAAVLRRSGTERGGSQTNTLLEILRPAAESAGENRNQTRRETQQQIAKNDFTQINQKLLNKSEVRSNDMNADDQHRRDRSEALRNDYQERIEQRRTLQQSAPSPASQGTSPPDVARPGMVKPSEVLLNQNHSLLQQNASEVAGASVQPLSPGASAPKSTANAMQMNVSPLANINTPTMMPTSAPPPSAPPQTFTIFTPAGRFGQAQKKSEEYEDEKEEKVEEKKQNHPFAMLEAFRAETTRPIQQKHPQQTKKLPSQPVPQQVAATPREEPKEIEADKNRIIKTLQHLLNSPQNFSAQKKEETNQPDQARYLKRVAEACEAAARYAPIRIKINLDHLGTMTLRFYHKAGRLALCFETPTRESAEFLRNNLNGLQTLLSKRNVKTMDVEILLLRY